MSKKKHYDWGSAELEPHSLKKHDVLVEYLLRYFDQRTLNARGREVFRITLVDGFCGGGLYRLKGSNEEVFGSPLRMLDAVKEAQFRVNRGRTKPIELQVQYVFVDKDPKAISYLKGVLLDRGYGEFLGKSIHLIANDFGLASDQVLHHVRAHTPKASTAIFFLDQYGYSDVPAPVIKKILTHSNSEVVLTFHVSSFAKYTNDDFAAKIGEKLKIDIQKQLGNQSIEEIKCNDANWRRFIQGALYQALVADCGAKFFTPFFIKKEGNGHGEYWLLHLSQHHRAQDVMKQVHWQNQNHFVHYGGAGLNMLAPHTMGFMQEFAGGFQFDNQASEETTAALREDLIRVVHERKNPITFGELFASTSNTSPGTSAMYKEVFCDLVAHKEIIIASEKGYFVRQAKYMSDTDIIKINDQLKLFV